MISTMNSIEGISSRLSQGSHPVQKEAEVKNPFSSVLEETIDEIKFSKHASKRLDERSLHLTPEQTNRLMAGVEKAGAKGIQDSLVLMDSMAFIVNVPSQTVVTALDNTESLDKIFTNIDGAVII